jgi:hypothetical protein
MDPARAEELAELLSTGVWTHEHALMATDLEQLGLPGKVGVPVDERELMDLYPPPRGRQAWSNMCPARTSLCRQVAASEEGADDHSTRLKKNVVDAS